MYGLYAISHSVIQLPELAEFTTVEQARDYARSLTDDGLAMWIVDGGIWLLLNEFCTVPNILSYAIHSAAYAIIDNSSDDLIDKVINAGKNNNPPAND